MIRTFQPATLVNDRIGMDADYGIDARVMPARLLANGKSMTFRQTEGKLQIDIPQQAPDKNVSVIAVKTY